MTVCNQCQGRMVPDRSAVVPVLACEDCGRMIPLPSRKTAEPSRRARRREMLRHKRESRRKGGVRWE